MYYKFIIIIMNNIFGAQIPRKWIAKVIIVWALLQRNSSNCFNLYLNKCLPKQK